MASESSATETVAGVRPATVILCAWRNLLAETAECMLQLRDRGWGYVIKRGDALITRSRSVAVSNWYRQTDEDVFLMIDDDVVFEISGAEKVVELARRTRSVACAAYPVKDGTHLACRRFPGQEITFGPDSPPVEIVYPATGFMAVHRDVITRMIEARTPDGSPHFPLCGRGSLSPMWPFFDTFTLTGADGESEYLSEDYAFGEVARQLGFKIWLEPSVILFHMGFHPYHVHEMKGTVRVDDIAREPVPVRTADEFRMYLPEGDGVIARDIRTQGAWDIETRDAIREHLKPGDLFLDLGAHVGYYSLLAAQIGAEVVAVEPVPETAELLRRNAALNGYKIEVHQCAAVPEPPEAIRMELDQYNTGAAHRSPHGEIIVAGETVEHILAGRRPTFVKLDVEGDEYRLLKGNQALLDAADTILVEVSEAQLRRQDGDEAAGVLALLANNGFTLRQVIDRGTYSDWIAVRKGKAA